MAFTFGSDPEFMLAKGGKFYSAIGIVPGTKKNRCLKDGHQFYYDNVLAECSIKPAATRDEAVENIGSAIKAYANLVAPFRLVCQASQEYTVDQLRHKDALEAGCKPESCAYSLKDFETDEDMFQHTRLRSAGGHIHLGHPIPQKNRMGCYAVVRMMDLFVGIPSIFLDKDKTSKLRKKLYGTAGRFRRPKHGVEYRSMGNFWLGSPHLVELIYDLSSFAVDMVESGGYDRLWEIDHDALSLDANWNNPKFSPAKCHKCKGYDVKLLQKAITSMDKKAGSEFMPLIQKYLPADVFDRIEKIAEKQPDLYESWGLNPQVEQS